MAHTKASLRFSLWADAGLLTELQEIRAQSEYTGIQSDSVNRLQTKQLAEHAANIKALEVSGHSVDVSAMAPQSNVANCETKQPVLPFA